MRRIVCSVFALCCCSLVLAQEKTRSLSVELLGAQNVVGINYDSASLGMYHVKETSWFYSQPVPPETEEIAERYESKENRFGYFLFGNIGYRYQRTNGFMFRVGLSPSFNFGDKHGLSKSAFYPYIGLGWSF